MPRDERLVAELLRSGEAKLRNPKKIADILRILRLDELCSGLSDELLAELVRACRFKDEQALAKVLAATSDATLRNTLFHCMLSEQGRAEILEAVDLQLYNLERPGGGEGWTN